MQLVLESIFWISLALVGYTYLGYGILLGILVTIKRMFRPDPLEPNLTEELPQVTIVVAAYNEALYIKSKIENSLSLNYPAEKFRLIIVTDGSDDGTDKIATSFEQVEVFHQTERKGKIAAINRIIPLIETEITIFTDANSLLNSDAIINLVKHFQNSNIGAVAGEKRIFSGETDSASGAGEGIYWKYESLLKKWDAEFHSVVGAAGELFAIRTKLYEPISEDTLIEDFYLSMSIAANGHKVGYEPNAYAQETPSDSVKEELKRKIRIAAGGIQSIIRLAYILNPFRYGWLTFQYISHRVLRWTLAPLSLVFIFFSNLLLASFDSPFYQFLLAGQCLFYLSALAGHLLESRKLRIKAFFIPYYFIVMNYAAIAGGIRLMKGKQSVLWERSKRKRVKGEQ